MNNRYYICSPKPLHSGSFFNKTDLVAQLVEHLPFKERVLGSSPSRVTIKRKTPARNGGGFCFQRKAKLA